jgi:hypothetical protein
MFQDNRHDGKPDFSRGRESTNESAPPRPSANPHAQPLQQSELTELRRHFRHAEATVAARIQAGELGVPRELLPLVSALTALDFPVIDVTTGFERIGKDRFPGFPSILICEAAPPFAIRFEGHRQAFADALREIQVPLAIRLKHPLLIGFGPLRPEVCVAVLSPEIRAQHPHFLQSVERAYAASIEPSRQNHPLEEESIRRESNIALMRLLKLYVDEFRSDPRASPGVPITLLGNPGEPILLVAGDPHRTEPDLSDLHRNPQRARIIVERQSALQEFGSFLKVRALLGR